MSFKNTVKPILVLTLICLAVALLLAVVNYVASPVIAEATEEAERKARGEALPGATDFAEVDLAAYPDLPATVISSDGGRDPVGRVLVPFGVGAPPGGQGAE